MSSTVEKHRPPHRRITPVILCGGSGSRLWPLSREAKPKQLLALTGAESMLQMTARRVADGGLFAPAILVVLEEQAEESARHLEEAGVPAGRIIIEPCRRNTASAVAVAALAVDPDELLLILPSDHLLDAERLRSAVSQAADVAEEGWLVTFGIHPTRPETGYGYIKRGEPIGTGIFRAERFVEKPQAATAASFLDAGGYDWNAGIFLFKASVYLDALREHDKEIHAAAVASMSQAVRSPGRIRPDVSRFGQAPARSIDHAVMEKAGNIAILPIDMDWSDVGSWDAIYDLSDKDLKNNVIDENGLVVGSSGCLVRSDGKAVALVGVEDLIVVATEDSVLVVRRGETQRLREALDMVRLRKPDLL